MELKLADLGSSTSSGDEARGGLYLPWIRSGMSDEDLDRGNKIFESKPGGNVKRGPAFMATRAVLQGLEGHFWQREIYYNHEMFVPGRQSIIRG